MKNSKVIIEKVNILNKEAIKGSVEAEVKALELTKQAAKVYIKEATKLVTVKEVVNFQKASINKLADFTKGIIGMRLKAAKAYNKELVSMISPK